MTNGMNLDRRCLNAELPTAERVAILLQQMTVKEKVAQLVGNGVMAGDLQSNETFGRRRSKRHRHSRLLPYSSSQCCTNAAGTAGQALPA